MKKNQKKTKKAVRGIKKTPKKVSKPRKKGAMVHAKHFVLPYVIKAGPEKMPCGCTVDFDESEKTFCQKHQPQGRCGSCQTWSVFATMVTRMGELQCQDRNECYRRSQMKMGSPS